MRTFAALLALACASALPCASEPVRITLSATRAENPIVRLPLIQPARAAWVRGEVRIDGDLSDWPRDREPIKAAGSADPRDLSAVAYTGVSATDFYFACEVTDDKHCQREYGDGMWSFDSVQFALDPLCQRTRGRYGDYDHEIGLCFVDGAPLVWRWHRPAGMKNGRIDDAQLAVSFSEGRAIYEARIPLVDLWPLRPELLNSCGFAYVVNDSDGTRDREGFVAWASGIASGKDASVFGLLEFPDKQPASVSVSARCLMPSDPTPSATPQEWLLDVYAGHAGRLTLSCEGVVEHGKNAGSPVTGDVTLEIPAGRSHWIVRADLSPLAPARMNVAVKATLDGTEDAVPPHRSTVYVYTTTGE